MTTPPPPAVKAAARNRLPIRVFNGVTLALIGLAVLAQLLRLASVYPGAGIGGSITEGLLDLIGFTIVPGTLLALSRLVLNAVRCLRDRDAGPRLVVYGLVVALPFVVPLILADAISRANAPLAAAQGLDELESEQFLAGAEWARIHQPIHNTQCKGSHEFQRGCRNTIDMRRKAQRAQGYEWASKHLPEKAALCQGEPYFVLGCRVYFAERLEKPRPAGLAKYEGMTTAECKEAVNARYESARAIDLELENFHSIESTYRRHWVPDLAECENYDKFAASTFIPGAYERIDTALGQLRAGRALQDDEKSAILKDFNRMSTMRKDEATEAYMKRFDEYFRYLNGDGDRPVTVYPQLTCPEFQAKIDEMRRIDKDRSDAMAALRQPRGVVRDGATYAALNQQRIDMLWDLKLHLDGAAQAGCGDGAHQAARPQE